MTFDPLRAESFMTTHARLLDRRRFQLLIGKAEPAGVLAALAAYRNADGGYGWGLEPDLRAASSQPVGAMLALEVLAETPDPTTGLVADALLTWLADHALPDGGLPFALTVDDPTGCAPHWVSAAPTTSSLQMTSQVAGHAQLLAPHASVAEHPWLARATRYCVDTIRDLDQAPHAYELMFALHFLDALGPDVAEADELIGAMGRFLPPGGSMAVAGGAAGETLHPLDFSPRPGSPVRRLFSADAVAADLDRLTGLQQADGGWLVDFESASPAAALEWRGYATVAAVRILLAH